MNDFRFENTEYFYLLLVVPVLILLAKVAAVHAQKKLKLFSSNPNWQQYLSLTGPRVFDLSTIITILAFILIVIALARPQADPIVEEREGNILDIILALDVSSSMAAEDVAPSRLGKAKHSIETLLNLLSGDRVGLIAFAGSAVLVSPLTSDYGIIRSFLEALNPNTISNQGTNFAAVARTAANAFQRGSDRDPSADDRSHIIVLFSDGEQTEGDFFETAKEFAKQGIIFNTIAIGSEKGVPIPIRDDDGVLKGYKRDRAGTTVISKVNFDMLAKIADAGGGKAFRSSLSEREIQALYSSFRDLNRSAAKSIKARTYREYYFLPLALAFILLCLAYLPWPAPLRTRKIAKSLQAFPLIFAVCFSATAIAQSEQTEQAEEGKNTPLPSLVNPTGAPALGDDLPAANANQEAEKGWGSGLRSMMNSVLFNAEYNESKKAEQLFREGKHEEAAKIYNKILVENPDSVLAAFNTATNLAKAKKTKEAKALLEQTQGRVRELKEHDSSHTPAEISSIENATKFNTAGTSAVEKDIPDAVRQYADVITSLSQKSELDQNETMLLQQAKKNIEHLIKKEDAKNKLKQDEQKQNKKQPENQDQQKQSGKGNKDEQNQKSKNDDQDSKNNEPSESEKDGEQEKEKEQEQTKESENKNISTKRKQFKQNEVLSERQAKQILRSLRQHEGLLQRKFLQNQSKRSSGKDETEMDW